MVDKVFRREQSHNNDSFETGVVGTGIGNNDAFEIVAPSTVIKESDTNRASNTRPPIRLPERNTLDMSSSEAWSEILIMDYKKDNLTKSYNLLLIFDLFSKNTWISLFTATISGVINYFIIRRIQWEWYRILRNSFKASLALFDHISIISLILIAAYTANLASFLTNDSKMRMN